MSASELEHAQATLTGLLQLLVKHTRAPLVVSQLEGDAVMSYALEESGVSGQTFLEVIEDTYVAFRRAGEPGDQDHTFQRRPIQPLSVCSVRYRPGTHDGRPADEIVNANPSVSRLAFDLLAGDKTGTT